MSFYDDASLIMYPSGVKSGKIYSQKPTDGTGDLTFTRASTATRVNSSGLIEDVASNVPRIDYTGGGCGKLLLEPQRTNLLTYSEDIDNAAWSKTNCTVSSNAETSPDGATTADKIIPNNGVDISGQASYVRRLFSTSIGVSYKISFYAKSAGYDTLFLFTNIGGNITVTYNLSSNWQRYELSVRVGDGTTKVVDFGARDASVANGTDGVLLWGVQIEQGSYPTSYIPTSGAAVTRVVDSSITTAFSSIIGQTEGVLFLDITLTRESYDSTRVMQIDTGSDSNRIQIAILGSNISLAIVDGGVVQALFNSTIVSGINKLALAYKNNDAVGYHNGTQLGTDTICTIPSCSNLILGYRPGSASLGDFVNAILLYKQRLSNSQLETLTTV